MTKAQEEAHAIAALLPQQGPSGSILIILAIASLIVNIIRCLRARDYSQHEIEQWVRNPGPFGRFRIRRMVAREIADESIRKEVSEALFQRGQTITSGELVGLCDEVAKGEMYHG